MDAAYYVEMFKFGLLVLNAVLAAHVARTGRPVFWIYVIILVPFIGPLAYLAMEAVPSAWAKWLARDGQPIPPKPVEKPDPGGKFALLAAAAEDSPSADNRRLLAEALMERGEYNGALAAWLTALSPPHDEDPALLAGLARCRFARGEHQETLDAMNAIDGKGPMSSRQEMAMMRARCLEGTGRIPEALEAYRAVEDAYPGEEARARRAMLLARCGSRDEALAMFRAIVQSVSRGTREYRTAQGEWANLALRFLSDAGAGA